MSSYRLQIDGTRFRDCHGREVTIHGINVAGDAKLPANPDQPSHIIDGFFDGDNVSFVGRPFPLEEADIHFARLKSWGYNTLRYVFTWEAIEAAGPGKYDEDWIQFTISILRKAKEYGFYIFMDPHQDVWSRFSGGSGAPMWTLYACGFDPRKFYVTEAALVHNTWPNPAEFPKMVWTTNYYRLLCQTIFTMFFGGKVFTPKCIIDGVNIQDYLQDHFLNAVEHLARRIKEAGDLDSDVIIGWESMNEPNRGAIGLQDMTAIPKEQKLQLGTSPKFWQSILLGSGRACEVEIWAFGNMGPYKSGSTLVDPQSESCWLSADYDDSFYGWKRDPGWKLGECIWAQHGIWDPSTDTLLRKDYFAKDPRTGKIMDYKYFTDTFFMDYYRKHSKMIRDLFPLTIMFCQAPVLEIPPSLKGTDDEDPNMVFAPHFYDGVTLMMKKWNRLWNIDVFGVLRGKYSSPIFAIKIGERAIRNCFKDQLQAIHDEGKEYMGDLPCVFTEIGIPYDMDDKYAYKTGDYSSQTAAMDANMYAIEGSKVNGMATWVYVACNDHVWGDNWNGEDLSIVSKDDNLLPSLFSNGSVASLDPTSPSYSRSLNSSTTSVNPLTLKNTLASETMSLNRGDTGKVGYRAAEAYVRPAPMATHGNVLSYGFDLRNCTFTLSLNAPSSTSEAVPTEIYLPEFHFPQSNTDVEVTGGKWKISTEEAGEATLQVLQWWHAEGEQTITVKGVKRKAGALTPEEEEGYLQQCQPQRCAVM
ncbi:glycosyl hydrolase-like protein [Rhizodiscina lignyota]|uniref:Glycosyl hydrolase-like protein n=1 Tax=Rhizodiscina lignyota TaxID=1504668 RepID=A0A9P4IAC5_9PEZI|nr:glycosyl hydrolase-like protein [Rhizodiscina lignyota]